MQKKVLIPILMGIFLWLLAACTPGSQEVEATPVGITPPPATTTQPTDNPLPTSEVGPVSTALPFNLQNISFQGVSFNYDHSLATAITPAILPGYGGGPAIPDFAKSGVSVHFDFSGFPATPLYQQPPHIDIFDVHDYTNLSTYAGAEIENLKALLAERPAESGQLPYLPLANAAQVFQSQVEYLDFNGGSGVRFVTYYAEDVSPITNGNIFYTFQGLTNDGNYYISATFPVTSPVLPADYDSAPIVDYDVFATNYENYLRETVTALNGLALAEFTPDLVLLDGIFQSITIATDLELPQTEIPTLNPCQTLPRPALVTQRIDFGNVLTFFDPAGNKLCDLELQSIESGSLGSVQTANGHLFYSFNDWANNQAKIWHVAPDGSQTELPFVVVNDPNTFSQLAFVVSDDGSNIAWSNNVYDEDANHDHASLFIAHSDGSNIVTLLNEAEIANNSTIQPIRFTQDNNTLIYAIQPYGIGGTWTAFNGRYHSAYTIPTTGGNPILFFDCATINQTLCIGDISADGQRLAYTNPPAGVITIIDPAGNEINTITITDSNYFGYPTYNPSATNLAYYSATVDDTSENSWALPTPGQIHLLTAPGQSSTLLSEDNVSGIWNWLNDTTLVYTQLAENGNLLFFLLNTNDGSTQPIPIMIYYVMTVSR